MSRPNTSESGEVAGGSIPPLTCSIPEGFGDLPFLEDRPRILRFEAGLALDPQLRKLARLSGAVDRTVALCLARLSAGSGFVRLGYGTFGSFVRERLSLPPRTASEFVRVGKALARLPLLDDALRQGRVAWTSAAQVARLSGAIPSEADQSEWVARAERLSVRELTAAVSKALGRARRGRPSAIGADGEPTDSSAAEGACAAGVVAGGSGGAQGAAAQQGESAGSDDSGAVRNDVAEGPRDEAPDPESRRDEQDLDDDPLMRLSALTGGRTAFLWGASLELCELVVGRSLGAGEGEEYILADFLSGTAPPPEDHVPCLPLGAPLVHPRDRTRRRDAGSGAGGPDGPAAAGAGPALELGDRRLSIELSAEIARALKIVESPVPDEPFAMDDTMRRLLAARAGIDLDLARLLRNFQSLNLARHLGFDGFGHYARERLGISVARARFLVTLDRRLTGFSALSRAVRRGHVGTVAALLVARVARPGASVRAWIDRARTRTVVRLREEVAWAERRAERLDCRYDGMPPPTAPLPSDLSELTAHVTGRDTTDVPKHCSHEPWVRVTGDPALDDAIDGDRHNSVGASGDAGSPECSGAGPAGFEMSADGPDVGPCVRVGFALRESAVASWIEARQRIGVAGGLDVVSDSRILFELAVAFLRTYMPLWLEHVESGDPIAVRDRFRCQMPGCDLRRGAAHHLRFRSRGGSDDPDNLLFVCERQHLDGVHDLGSIRVSGRAPDLLVVELGIRPDGTALETFVRRPA